MTPLPYVDELRFARDFATRAGDRILRFATDGYSVDTKTDRTVVTTADLEVNHWFIEQVIARFPGDGVLGEEACHPSTGDRTWVIDPVDGTQQFVLGIPVFMVSIALVDDGEPVVGVAHNPSTRETFWATTGGGAFRNGTPIHVSSRDGVAEPLTIAGSGATPVPSGLDSDALIRAFVSPSLRSTAYRFPWPTVFSGTKVAEGTWDADLYNHTAAHDVAAVCVLVREAGGTVTDRTGTDQRYDAPVNGCVLTNGRCHDELIRQWKTASSPCDQTTER
jgi:histidinol-phosphatase